MKNFFGKKANVFKGLNKKPYATDALSNVPLAKTSDPVVIKTVGGIVLETRFKPKDVAILRECLAGLHSKVPPVLAKKITDSLRWFADSIKDYCQCEEKVFIANENRYACLNCGFRHKNANGKKIVTLA